MADENIDFSNSQEVITKLLELLKGQQIPSAPLPPPLILGGASKSGLSPSKIAAKIIARQEEAGIPVGALPDGQVSPDEIMERIRIEEIVNAIVEDLKLSVAIQPGVPIIATGANAGGPVVVQGTTILYGQGYAAAQ